MTSLWLCDKVVSSSSSAPPDDNINVLPYTPCCVKAVTVCFCLINTVNMMHAVVDSLPPVFQQCLGGTRERAAAIPTLSHFVFFPDDAVHAAPPRRNPPETFNHDSRRASPRCRQVWPWSFFPSGPATAAPDFPGTSPSQLNRQTIYDCTTQLWRQQKTAQTSGYLWDPAMILDGDLLTQDIFLLVV